MYLRICVIVYLCILHLIHGNVIFDIFESHAFQKYSTCWVLSLSFSLSNLKNLKNLKKWVLLRISKKSQPGIPLIQLNPKVAFQLNWYLTFCHFIRILELARATGWVAGFGSRAEMWTRIQTFPRLGFVRMRNLDLSEWEIRICPNRSTGQRSACHCHLSRTLSDEVRTRNLPQKPETGLATKIKFHVKIFYFRKVPICPWPGLGRISTIDDCYTLFLKIFDNM